MFKLIKNELLKIFKRKNIYILMIVLTVIIVIYNFINPDQNKIGIENETTDRTMFPLPNNDIKQYIQVKVENDFSELYNSYENSSWQRYALNDELTIIQINNNIIDAKNEIKEYLRIINEYELNEKTTIKIDEYINANEKYNEYKRALDEGDWKKFVDIKIRNLYERKSNINLDYKLKDIETELEIYNFRLQYNIKYENNIQNEYLKQYRSNMNYYNLTDTTIEDKAKIELISYAIKNNIVLDISSSNSNLILNNKIDARNSFIKTFTHFDIIIVIVAIYISSIIITEETNRGTIKQLLIKPYKRNKIIISKIIACIITVIITIMFVITIQFIAGGIVFGFNSYKLGYIGYDYANGKIMIISLFNYIILVGLSKMPMYIMVIVFCMFIGTINNNIPMSIILSTIVFILAKSTIAEFSKIPTISIISRFLITNNWDFSIYLFGASSNINGVNVIFSTVIYIIYIVILLKLLVKKFEKKEINNI